MEKKNWTWYVFNKKNDHIKQGEALKNWVHKRKRRIKKDLMDSGIDGFIAETMARRIIHLLMGGVATPGRVTRKEVSVGSIPTRPTLNTGTDLRIEGKFEGDNFTIG